MADTPITSKICVYKEYDSKEDVNRNNVGYKRTSNKASDEIQIMLRKTR